LMFIEPLHLFSTVFNQQVTNTTFQVLLVSIYIHNNTSHDGPNTDELLCMMFV